MHSPGSRKLRLAVLVSGGGTNLQAIIDRSAAGTLDAEVVVVLSDRSSAFGLERAKKANIPAFPIDYRSRTPGRIEKAKSLVDLSELDSRQKIIKSRDPAERMSRLARLVAAEDEMIRVLDSFRPDFVCLAGFMRLLTPYFIGRINGCGPRIVNIHPALLPSFPGTNGYEDTFEYGCKWGGVTVHFVDEGEDTGPVIAQAVYPIWPEDDIQKVRNRGLAMEYVVYPQVIDWLAAGHAAIKSGPGGRTFVRITDPDYAAILAGWLELACRRPG
ncbi:MAG: phosphoribosylglycinamide formyltransferase [Syntrophobacteraceae bacterium]|nr:phosphoribosylglycinamide formyltransferase [Syntrophobacteraceae bacterium]